MFKSYLCGYNTRPKKMKTILIDGADFPTLHLFLKQASIELEFLEFSSNIQSFENKINDLSWLEGIKVRISISNAKEFLIEEDNQVRKTILQVLLEAMENEYAKSPILVLISKD